MHPILAMQLCSPCCVKITPTIVIDGPNWTPVCALRLTVCFVQMPLQVAPLDAPAAAAAAQQHALLHYSSSGIDAPQPTDLFYRLKIHQCFFVGGIGSTSAAEHLNAEEYRSADPDPLRRDAPTLVSTFNRERTEDVLRVGAFAVRPFASWRLSS